MPRPRAASRLPPVLAAIIETDDRIVGFGEALARYSLRAYLAIVEDMLAPRLVGRDPFHVEGLWQEMLRAITGKAGGMLLEAIAACDIALWDIMGKACGRPLHHMLGSMGRARVAAYASSVTWAADEIAVKRTEAALAAGFTAIKIKIGLPAERAIARAALIRRVAGERVELTADGNWSYDFDTSVRIGRAALARFRVG